MPSSEDDRHRVFTTIDPIAAAREAEGSSNSRKPDQEPGSATKAASPA